MLTIVQIFDEIILSLCIDYEDFNSKNMFSSKFMGRTGLRRNGLEELRFYANFFHLLYLKNVV
jgi:hypothetical protein